MHSENPVWRPGLIIAIAAFPFAVTATAQTAGQHRCASALQGKVAWNHSGNKQWSGEKVARLCKGAENSAEPARCFETVMHGGVSWGGGTRWQTRNAISLCQGAKNADARVSCFRKKIAGQTDWRGAIGECGGAGTLTMPDAPGKRLRPDVRKLQKPPAGDLHTEDDDSRSGSIRFGDGEHGRRPSTDKDGADIRKGAGPSRNITDRPFRERDLGRKGDALSADPDRRERMRLKPRVTGYRPSTVLQGGEVTVQGHMLGNRKGERRLVLGLNADPDHGLARELAARSWNDKEIRTRVPASVLPAKYFIALAGPDGKWLTNRLRTLRVLGKQRVSVRAVIIFGCYAEVTRHPRQVQASLKPVRPGDMGMERDGKFSIPIPYRKVTPGELGRRFYVYTATANVPQGLFKVRVEAREGAAPFKAKNWSQTGDSVAYANSQSCAERRRVNPETGRPLKKPPVHEFSFGGHRTTIRIGPRTRSLELSAGALANLGGLPPPTPVDE